MARALRTERFLILIDQLSEELGSQAKAEARLGMAKGYASKLRREGHRDVGARVLAEARRRLRIADRFFSDPSLGDTPRYRDFLGSPDSYVEHEDRAAWLELVDEGYVEYARGEGVLEEEIQSIRHYSDGRDGLAAEDFREMLDRAIARARRSLHFKASPADRELPESKEARERRQREGGRVTRLRGPEETPE